MKLVPTCALCQFLLSTHTSHLGGTDLVAGLVELLGIEGGTDAKEDTGAEADVVGNGGNTAVVDLGL